MITADGKTELQRLAEEQERALQEYLAELFAVARLFDTSRALWEAMLRQRGGPPQPMA